MALLLNLGLLSPHSLYVSHELVVCPEMETSSLDYNGAPVLGNKGLWFEDWPAI